MSLLMHPQRLEAITFQESVFTRWALTDPPVILATFVDDGETPQVITVPPDGDCFAVGLSSDAYTVLEGDAPLCGIAFRRWVDFQITHTFSLPSGHNLTSLGFSADRRWLAAADGGEQIYLVDRTTEEVVSVIPGGTCTSVTVFDSTTAYLAVACTGQGGGYGAIYTVKQQLQPLHVPLDRTVLQWPIMDFADTFGTAAFSPDGRLLALYVNSQWAPGWQGELSVYEVLSGQLQWYTRIDLLQIGKNRTPSVGIHQFISDICFTPEGTHVVIGSAYGDLLLFDTQHGRCDYQISTGTNKPVGHLAFDATGRRLWALVESRPVSVTLPG